MKPVMKPEMELYETENIRAGSPRWKHGIIISWRHVGLVQSKQFETMLLEVSRVIVQHVIF